MALLARHAPGSAACAQQIRAPSFGMAWRHLTASLPQTATRPALQTRRRAGTEARTGMCTCALREQPECFERRQPAGCFERRRLVRVNAGWGAEPEWQPCTVADTTKAAEGLVQLKLDIGALVDGYTKAGQCVQVKVGDSKPAYMAIASAPAAKGSEIELLIKNQGPTAELLCNVKAGDKVDVSPVIGSGFPVERAPAEKYPTLVVFATGTGIAPIRALIESSALDVGRRKDVRIYYGTFNPDSTAYAALKPQWEAEGMRVVNVYSGFGQGYVQDVFTKEPGVEDWAGVSAVLCGQKELAESMTAFLLEKGVSKESILTNW